MCFFKTLGCQIWLKKISIPYVDVHVFVNHSNSSRGSVPGLGCPGFEGCRDQCPSCNVCPQPRHHGWPGAPSGTQLSSQPAPHWEHTGPPACPSHRNKPQETSNQYNLNAKLSNYSQLQWGIKAPNKPAAQTAAEMKVWGVFCPFDDQILHVGGGSEAVLSMQGKWKIMESTVLACMFPKCDTHTNKNLKENFWGQWEWWWDASRYSPRLIEGKCMLLSPDCNAASELSSWSFYCWN